MPDGMIKAKLGGKDYVLRAELRIAPFVEAKTGKGIFSLARDVSSLSATTSEVVAVIGSALSVNGFELDADEIYDAIRIEGLAAANTLATQILFELLAPPKKKSKNGVAAPVPN